MDSETFALLLVQQVTLAGLIKLLDARGILSQSTIIEFLERVADTNKAEGDPLSSHFANGIEAMITSIMAEQAGSRR